MTLTYSETKDLIELVLATKLSEVRQLVHSRLIVMNRSEPEFYAGIIEHGPGMNLRSDQWFDLLSKLPARMLRDAATLMDRLSRAEKAKLPTETPG